MTETRVLSDVSSIVYVGQCYTVHGFMHATHKHTHMGIKYILKALVMIKVSLQKGKKCYYLVVSTL